MSWICDQNCGGFWEVNVYRIRPDVAVDVDDASWTLSTILILGGLGYFFGGILLGMRARGERKPSLQAHMHYTRWIQIHGLCQDGLAFCRARIGTRRVKPVTRQTREPLLDSDDISPSKRGGSKSRSSAARSSSKPSSSKKTSEKEEKRRRAKDKRREKKARGEKLTKQEEQQEKEEIEQEEKERQLRELTDSTGVHSSQAKIKVIGING